MLIISHRGNINGKIPELENNPKYIEDCLENYIFGVEIDAWFYKNNWFLGHDKPQYKISLDWLYWNCQRLWVHCKNFEALSMLSNKSRQSNLINYFWHENDDFTLTSNNLIWTNTNKKTKKQSIIVDLEAKMKYNGIYGVCTDFPIKYKTK